jgi:hypothetical protein
MKGAVMATKKVIDELDPTAVSVPDLPKKPVSRLGEYPRYAQSAHYQIEVGEPATGIPVARISPVGWVGAPPLVIPEVRIDELIELLKQVR